MKNSPEREYGTCCDRLANSVALGMPGVPTDGRVWPPGPSVGRTGSNRETETGQRGQCLRCPTFPSLGKELCLMATTHDDIDWAARLEMMRRSDALESDALRRVAVRLASGLGPDGVVVDAGCGSGGMSAALASVLRDNGGGRLILIDATEELLRAAQEVASSAGGETVTVTPVVADLGAVSSVSQLPPADLVWASGVVHHLPDRRSEEHTSEHQSREKLLCPL